jgi:hypothetical protein
MDLYTIVADYRGYRAVGQHQGASPRGALKSWLRPYRLGSFLLSKRTQRRVRKELLEFKEVGAERIQSAGIQNVWRIAALPRCEFLVHIIKTKKS